MAKETLTVKNFGPIDNATLDLRKVTVLIGEQASGKSVLAKLVAICADKFAPQNLTLKEFENYHIGNFFNEKTHFEFVGDLYSVDYKRLTFGRALKTEQARQVISKLESARNEYFLLQIQAQKEPSFDQREKIEDEIMYWQRAISEQVEQIRQLFSESCYVPAERVSIPVIEELSTLEPKIRVDKFFNFIPQFRYNYRNYKKEIKQLHLSPLNVNFESDGNTDTIRQNGIVIKFEESSTGIQSVATLMVVIEGSLLAQRKNHFIIEEPELNLYPTTQKKLVEYLIEKCTKGDNRLIITTHSPYILTALNNCIQARNTLREHPEHADEVAKLVRPESQIDYEDVMAYFVAGGTAKPIMNNENRLIDANALDDVSNELSETFDRLLDLEMQPA